MRKDLIAFIGFLIVGAICLIFFIQKALLVLTLMATSLVVCYAVYKNFNLRHFLTFFTIYILALGLITLAVMAFVNHYISNIYILVSILLFILFITLWGWIPDSKIRKFLEFEAKVLSFIFTVCGIVFIIGQMDVMIKNDRMIMEDRVETRFSRAIEYLYSDSNPLIMLGIDSLEEIALVEYENENKVRAIYSILKDKWDKMQESADFTGTEQTLLLRERFHYLLTNKESVFSKFHEQTSQ